MYNVNVTPNMLTTYKISNQPQNELEKWLTTNKTARQQHDNEGKLCIALTAKCKIVT